MKQLAIIFSIMVVYSSLIGSSNAAIRGTSVVQFLRFGTIVPITGSCEMDFNTGVFTSDLSNNCPVANGSPGKYKIITDSNTLVRIAPIRFIYAGNLFTFIPSGEVTNGLVTKALVANNATIIDSGPSGIIDMKIGGTLSVTSPLAISSSYIVDLEVDIVEVP